MSWFYSKKVWNPKRGDFVSGAFEVKGGRFSQFIFGTLPPKNQKWIDLGGSHVGPSCVDVHIHARDFEECHKETFETLSEAAAKGGVSVGACLANTFPRMDSPARVQEFLKRVKNLPIRLIPFAAVTENLEGKTGTNWNALLKMPIAGLSDDGKPILNAEIFGSVLKAVSRSGKILSLHEEDTTISKGSLLHESHTSCRLGIEGSCSGAEIDMVSRDLEIAKKVKDSSALHFAHVSTGEAVRLLKAAKKRGQKFSAELTPHHGLLSVDHAEEFPAMKLSTFKVCPPIRAKEDQEALWAGLRDGVIDMFASDHAPHSLLEKTQPMEIAAHGMIGLEFYFPLINEIRLRTKLSWQKFFEAAAERPASRLSLHKTRRWAVGADASFIVFNPTAVQKLHWSRSKSANTPFQGASVRGKVEQHWINGVRVYGETR